MLNIYIYKIFLSVKKEKSSGMEGFGPVFKNCEKNFGSFSDNKLYNLFSSFRLHKECFAFIENGDTPPDQESIQIANSINPSLYTHFLSKIEDRPLIGYSGSSIQYANYNNLDSRHIMMLVILWHYLPIDVFNILEIGGGYANFLYLNRDKKINQWTIIDLPFIGKLQQWCLHQLQIDSSKYKLISAYDYSEAKNEKYDLVIGTHSLSELPLDIFNDYFDSIIKNVPYFFYCYHLFTLKSLTDIKRKTILEHFDIICEIKSEGGNVLNCLFKNKKL